MDKDMREKIIEAYNLTGATINTLGLVSVAGNENVKYLNNCFLALEHITEIFVGLLQDDDKQKEKEKKTEKAKDKKG